VSSLESEDWRFSVNPMPLRPNLQFPKGIPSEINVLTDERQSVDIQSDANGRLILQSPYFATGKMEGNRGANMHETHDDHIQAIPNIHLIPPRTHVIHEFPMIPRQARPVWALR
jgi:hypothetical protein